MQCTLAFTVQFLYIFRFFFNGFCLSYLFVLLNMIFAGIRGENKQRFNLSFCVRGSGKASIDYIPGCCSQLYASFPLSIAFLDLFIFFFKVASDFSNVAILNQIWRNNWDFDFIQDWCLVSEGFYWFFHTFNPCILD